MEEYKEAGKDKWESFTLAFNHDMDVLNGALINFSHPIKNRKYFLIN
ncbi:MAG: hypothetical protein PHE33_02390 [Bacteroidales bacterium]|nr:hypothetical protein [Bacteroidales bacterium]